MIGQICSTAPCYNEIRIGDLEELTSLAISRILVTCTGIYFRKRVYLVIQGIS